MDNTNLKSFWSRPEGKVGMVLLGGSAAALGLKLWSDILPWLLKIVWDTYNLVALVGGLFLAFLILTSKRTHVLFRAFCRKLVGFFIPVTAVEIMKDGVSQARKHKEKFEENTQQTSASMRDIDETRRGNERSIEDLERQSATAQALMLSPRSPEERMRAQSALTVNRNQIGRLRRSNEEYTRLYNTLKTIYDKLVALSIGLDTFIADKSATVEEWERRKKAIGRAHGAISAAIKIIRGSAEQEDMEEEARRYLAEDANTKLGEMDDMLRYTDEFLTRLDIKNGTISEEALAALDKIDPTKLLGPAVTQPMTINAEYKVVNNDYAALLRK